MARYRLSNHPTFQDLLSKEDLYHLVARGSLARGDICEDTRTGSSHKVGEVIGGMAPPGRRQARVARPAYQEFRADDRLDAEEAAAEDDAGEEEDEDFERTATGERIYYRRHPSWFAYWKPLLLFVLLGIASGLAFQFGARYLVIGASLALVTILATALTRFSKEYLVTEERVEIVWGIIGRSSKEVRVRDIRSIDVHESGLTGLIGIGTVDFSSAANSGVEVQFRDIRKAHRVKELVRVLQKETASPSS
jgi:membrane protein YdbS with pleckstrin-like domain